VILVGWKGGWRVHEYAGDYADTQFFHLDFFAL